MDEIFVKDMIAATTTLVTAIAAIMIHRAKEDKNMDQKEFWDSEEALMRQRISANPIVMSAALETVKINVDTLTHQVDHMEKQLEDIKCLIQNRLLSK